MKVYVITEGDYSEYHIIGVTTDKKTAETYVAIRSNDCFEPTIETYETDEFSIMANPKIKCYIVQAKNGNFTAIESSIGFEYPEWIGDVTSRKLRDGTHFASIYVLAKSEDQAIKIAQDKMARYKAVKANIV